jgi:predicted porin
MVAGTFTNTEDQVSNTYKTTSRLTQIYNKVGVQYQSSSKSGDWVFGATYGYKQKVDVKNTFFIYTGSQEEVADRLKTTNQFLPENYGVGFSWKKGKMMLAADYEWERWGGLKSNVDKVKIGDSHKIKAGIGYTPYRDLYTAHLAKQYQFGVVLNKSYIEMKNKAAWNYAITTGVQFPLKAGQTQKGILSLGLEYGSNLTAPSGFVKENYLMLNVNFSFIEAMFMRSKIF